MSNEDWYRNSTWSDDIESQFMAKLKRARRKEQYLRIQASYLAKTNPDVAIKLLAQYFELEDDFDHAQAYCDYAAAYLSLGDIEKAINNYALALEREKVFSNLLTDAYILYPMTVVKYGVISSYADADKILDENQERLMFPIDHFRWNAAKAIIENDRDNIKEASSHAEKALDAAEIKKSGFRFHQKLGLVGKEYTEIVNELRAIYA
ncbi:MAG: tetratricopeptide (TPR) repeat protein [Polaribacter sp.]